MAVLWKGEGKVEMKDQFKSVEEGIRTHRRDQLDRILSTCLHSNNKFTYELFETIMDKTEIIMRDLSCLAEGESPTNQYTWMAEAAFDETKWHIKKNNDYGSANITGFGVDGIVVRLWDKVCRLMNLYGYKIKHIEVVKTSPKKEANEAIEDTILDMSIYSRIARCILNGQWGK